MRLLQLRAIIADGINALREQKDECVVAVPLTATFRFAAANTYTDRVHSSTFASCLRNHEGAQVGAFLLKNAKVDLMWRIAFGLTAAAPPPPSRPVTHMRAKGGRWCSCC